MFRRGVSGFQTTLLSLTNSQIALLSTTKEGRETVYAHRFFIALRLVSRQLVMVCSSVLQEIVAH